jgi:hypothetical protein
MRACIGRVQTMSEKKQMRSNAIKNTIPKAVLDNPDEI